MQERKKWKIAELEIVLAIFCQMSTFAFLPLLCGMQQMMPIFYSPSFDVFSNTEKRPMQVIICIIDSVVLRPWRFVSAAASC
jgi:hypothetical protein